MASVEAVALSAGQRGAWRSRNRRAARERRRRNRWRRWRWRLRFARWRWLVSAALVATGAGGFAELRESPAHCAASTGASRQARLAKACGPRQPLAGVEAANFDLQASSPTLKSPR